MTKKWQPVSPQTAKTHPLYGIKGWLLVFAISNLLGFLAILGSVRKEAFDAGISELDLLSISHPNVTYLKLMLFFTLTSFAIKCYLLFSKHLQFRNFVSILLLIDWPVVVCIALMTGSVGVVGLLFAAPLVGWGISCAVWITYLQKSRRVRVTFENCIKDEEMKNRQTAMPTQIISKQQILPGSTFNTNIRPDVVTKAIINPATAYIQNSNENSDDNLWEEALNEYDSNTRKQGLYARLYSDAQGNETIVKANYLRVRVDEIKQLTEVEKGRIGAAQILETTKQVQILETAKKSDLLETMDADLREYIASPKGICPDCEAAVLPVNETICPKCLTEFGLKSKNKLIEPLSQSMLITALRRLALDGHELTVYEVALLKFE